MNEFQITYADGTTELMNMNATLKEVHNQFVGSYWPVGKGGKALLAVSVDRVKRNPCRGLDEGPTVQCPTY